MSAASPAPRPTADLATWLASLELGDVPERVRERAKDVLLDGIGCAVVGAKLPWSETAVEIVTRLEGAGDSVIIGWDRTASPPVAALLNGTFVQGFELDDFHPTAPLHSASLIVPALLAGLGGDRAISGETALLAAIAGFETGPRVGHALHGAEMLSRGWHSGPVFGTFTAAATTGVLLGLDAERFEDALGLAATQSGGLMAAQFDAMSKRMHHGFAARGGVYAAHLAAGGYTGIRAVFERGYGGFLSTFGEGHDPDASQIALDLGTSWETERIVVKAHAAMGGLHTAIDAILELCENERLDADAIERIEIDLADAVFHHGWWPIERPIVPITAQMNIAYAVAVAIVDRAALVAQFAPARINADDVWRIVPRIVARHEPEFDRAGKLGRARTRMHVHLTDGRVLKADKIAPQSFLVPLDRESTLKKYRSLTDGLIERSRQLEIERLVLDLESVPDASALATLLGPRVGAAFGTEPR